MQIATFALASLVPFAENPRKADSGDHDALLASIKAFGIFKPSLVWQGTDHPEGVTGPIVIGGNQRYHTLRAAMDAGLFKDGPLQVELRSGVVVTVDPGAIPCVAFPGSWAEAKVVALRDNAQEGEWDWDALPSYVKDLEGAFPEGVDLTLTGFDAQTLKDLEALATDPLVGLDRIGGGTGVPVEGAGTEPAAGGGGGTSQPAGGDKDTSALTRQGARVVIGNIRGKVPVALYERLATVIKTSSGRLGTTDLTPILEDWVGTLEKHEVAKAPKPKAPKGEKGKDEKGGGAS
jgi:hypothetical protein